MKEKDKITVKRVYIDPTGELCIVMDNCTATYRKERAKSILLDNAFLYKGLMHTLFDDHKDPHRIALLETINT